MGKRLIIDNPFYDGNASSSAFGWEFQVDAAIFLFIKYIDQIEKIVVEGKYQDIELICKNNKHIYAQAKSISNGSNENRKKKLEDAIISLAKTPADTSLNDDLLYISNYSAPINEKNIFNNSVIRLKNQKDEKIEFEKQINILLSKLDNKIKNCNNNQQKGKLDKLKKRISNINTDEFLVSTIFPYGITEQKEDKYVSLFQEINLLLSNKYGIRSQSLQDIVRRVLVEWHFTFLYNSTISPEKIEKSIDKDSLLWQIVVILSDIDIDMEKLMDEEIEYDLFDEFESYWHQYNTSIHVRFDFFNRLISDFKKYKNDNCTKKHSDFVKDSWEKYMDEFREFNEYSDLAKEYLIKKSIMKLLNSKNNINKIIEGNHYDN